MEMKEIDTGGEAGNDLLEAKPQDPLEGDYHYSRLKKPSEDIYSEAFFSPASQKQPDKRAERNLRLYRAACVVLLVISLILLVAVIALSVQREYPQPWLSPNRSPPADLVEDGS
ncbi:unnamed protein product [Lampetra planeri]